MNFVAEHALVDLIRHLTPISSLEPERIEEIARMCILESFGHDSLEIDLAGSSGRGIYLTKGEAKLRFADGSIEVLVAGSNAALHPLGSGLQPVVACKPITEIELLRLDEDTLDLVMVWSQSAESSASNAEESTEVTDWRMMSGMFSVQNLAQSAFAPLPPANIAILLERFERVVVERGEIVVRENDAGNYFYLVESGRCQVSRLVGGVELEVAVLRPGDVFGEEALLANANRNATVTMKTNGILLRLDKKDFFELLSEPLLDRVSLSETNRRVANGAQLIDVRFAAEFVHDGLPGAINIPLNEIRRSIALLDADKDYIVYCQSGRRSSAAAFLLSQRGLQASVLMDGFRGGLKISPEAAMQ